MLRTLRACEPIVAKTFDEADRIMKPLLGKPLSEFIFVDSSDPAAVAKAEDDLRQTEITQPAVLTVDIALTRLLAAYGIEPDFTMGHSLGEYGALVASGALPFAEALEAVSARGKGMTRVSLADNGRMAAVFAPLEEIERILQSIPGYLVVANINSEHQAVVGGASDAVQQAIAVFQKAGYEAAPLPVSHAFHTSIVAPASEPLRRTLERLHLQSPQVPVVANVSGDFYPQGPDVVAQMIDILSKQVASPVQFVKGLRTLYKAGARTFVELGPKKALYGFAEDVLGKHDDVLSLFTNHPKSGDLVSLNQALCGLYAAGLGSAVAAETGAKAAITVSERGVGIMPVAANERSTVPATPHNGREYADLGKFFADVLERGWQLYHRSEPSPRLAPIVITGAALGLPGTDHVFDDSNITRILRGDQFIDLIPTRLRKAMLEKHITRLVKSDDNGPSFETINDIADVIKLAGRGGDFDLEHEYGIPADRDAAFDRVTQLAIAAGIDALRDAGIPLVMRYKTTSKGTSLPDRWGLPDSLRDDTGVIFASAFPGYDSFADEMARYYKDRSHREQLSLLQSILARSSKSNGDSLLERELERHVEDLRDSIEKEPYFFNRRFLLRTLSMGHSQFAEFVGARGPNTQINSACASTAQAVSLAEDWIHAGRCRRVIIVSADDVTSDHNMEWFGAGFLASGAAATDESVEAAATPFDRRRHGLIVGMGAASMVVESEEAARERGIQPICGILSTVTANSAFHGTRLDVQHIAGVMEDLMCKAETLYGISRDEIAPRTVFVSHETYTPARGGSASAEVNALRRVFGNTADQIVIANTKGFTGHAMGAGIEDVVAIKALETGLVPPIANFKEVDPELGILNLSKGGSYPVEYAIRLGAGFGSQVSMTLLRWTATANGAKQRPNALGYLYRITDKAVWDSWLKEMTGYPTTDLEVVNRTLRVRDQRSAAKPASVVVKAEVAAPPIEVPTEPARPLVEVAKAETQTTAPAVTIVAKEATEEDPVKQKVLELVAQKTGYPIDMLALDLDLEADLGIDTVKQAEVFASIRESYGIPRDDKIRLRDFPTLAHVIHFVHERRPDTNIAASVPLPVQPPPGVTNPKPDAVLLSDTTLAEVGDPVKKRILALVVEKTGYPEDMLDLDLDLEADLGVDTVKQAEMFAAIREIYQIPRDESRKLRDYPTLAHVMRFVYEKRPDLARPASTASSDSPEFTAAPQPESAATAPPLVAESVVDDPIKKRVLAIVAEKTGYPEDMLDLDLDLEADLGIDTVKQAEMFAAVREAYNIPRDENLKLRDFPTLAHVIQFAHDRSTRVAAVAPAKEPVVADSTEQPRHNLTEPPARHPRPIPASLDAANRIPRRVPVPLLRPPITLFKETGVKLARGTRVMIVPDASGVADAMAKKLQARNVEVKHLDPLVNAEALASTIREFAADGPITGVYWLPSLDPEASIRQLNPSSWHEALRIRVKSLFAVMRALYNEIAGVDTFLVSATRMGGQHGYDDAGSIAPAGGAVVGFSKAYKRERMEALVKALDFELHRNPEEIADILVEETLHDPGAIEIGYKGAQRWTVGLEEQPPSDANAGIQLDEKTVFLVTGAAGSIVSAITADLASASGGTFYLLDLVPKPDPADPDLKRLATDREGLKRDLFARIQKRGERPTPALIEKELGNLERAQAAQTAIDAVLAAGGKAHYFSVNLVDSAAVAGVIDEVRQRSGRIDVLLHAAGLDRSHPLPDKDPKEFDLVFDVKADGFFNLLHAIGDMPLGATVAFSSIAGRFGNLGQTDYSAANDLLCKVTSSFRTTRPTTRGIAIDWTAWAGIGMAARGSIPKIMEQAGIDMLPPDAGIPLIRRELTAGTTRGEVVIAQRLGVLLNEFDSNGGVDTSAPDLQTKRPYVGPVSGGLAKATLYDGFTTEVTLDPEVQAFLYDHRIDGTPVLPGVMGIELFAEAALSIVPDFRVRAIEDISFHAPVKFYRNEPRTLRVETRIHSLGEELIADCRLIGTRSLPNQPEPQTTTHFTGRIWLTREPMVEQSAITFIRPEDNRIDAADIYGVYFHGPAYRVIEKAWWDGSQVVGQFTGNLPANHHPSELNTIMAPRLIELCFQTAGLWEMGVLHRMGLPRHVGEVSVLRDPNLARGALYAVVTPKPDLNIFDAQVIDAKGTCYLRLVGYQTVELPGAAEDSRLKRLQTAFSAEVIAAA